MISLDAMASDFVRVLVLLSKSFPRNNERVSSKNSPKFLLSIGYLTKFERGLFSAISAMGWPRVVIKEN